MRRAFTMIELVFIIVILGILATVALPRLSPIMDDAKIGKAKSDVAALRSAIASERQARILQGNARYALRLDNATSNTAGEEIFNGDESNASVRKLLTYPIITGTGNGEWMKNSDSNYTFKASSDASTVFTYSNVNGMFSCSTSTGTAANDDLCKQIIY